MNNYLNCDNFGITKTFLTINDLNNNLIEFNDSNETNNLRTLDEFNLYHLISLKKINYDNQIFGFIKIQMKYFLKKIIMIIYLNMLIEKLVKL